MGPAVVVAGGGAMGAGALTVGLPVGLGVNTGAGPVGATGAGTGWDTTGPGGGVDVDGPPGRNVLGRPELASELQAAINADKATAAWVGWIRWMRIGPTEGDGFTETQLCT